MRGLMKFFDHLLQKHILLPADAMLVIPDQQLLNVFLQHFATTLQYGLTHKISSLLIWFSPGGKFFISL